MNRNQAKALLPIIQAYAEGKAIESRCIKGDTSLWYDDEDPSFDDDFEYRIKTEPKYRPFANAEECWVEMCKHHPFGWVKTKQGTHRLIVLIDEERLMAGAQNIEWSYRTLFNEKFTFVDGTPFGVKVELC